MRRAESRGAHGFWPAAAAGLAAVLLTLAAWVWITGRHPVGPHGEPAAPPSPPPRHILVLGVDEREYDVGRSDTMILARLEPESGTLRLLSIPRDTMVRIPGYGPDKANSAYAYGGPALAKETVARLIGQPVDYYVKVNLLGFRHLVDLMGGIEYTVEKRMHYVDPYDDLVIDLKPGRQVLDGRKAEQYVRYRHDAIGDDVGRVERQQALLKAALQQALTAQNLPRIPSLVYTAIRYVDTDIPVAEQVRLLNAFLTARERRVEQAVIPGAGDYVDGISYFLPDEAAFRTLLQSWN
jgi:polyisoprenyl-teichoic acid--peptidoglycan teichoic acid transferase